MKPVTYYALRCAPKDEKVLIGRVNAYLETLHRTTSKAKQPSLLQRYAPFVIKHFYWNLNKDTGTWFDIYPNQDTRGEFFFPAFQDHAWLLHVRIDTESYPDATEAKAEQFIASLLAAIGFDAVVVQENDEA
ncbi:hypothetical protein WI77_10665 [Burkholderia ubonensis]|uniref:hypothetical protein n=1 Tax=Burkholderia ubonensis TaxID=101571 RepID=UPI00075D563B|nr:hypothetical protein [Burkholderia ubonensis]KVC94940.1 hypothetical protein WI77_10665 [Burkholderia ubonensis]